MNQQTTFFDEAPSAEGGVLEMLGGAVGLAQVGHNAAEFDQYMTPLWAAEALVEQIGITSADRVVEPSCGAGAFLRSFPAGVECVGVEIDPKLALLAAKNSGRPVITGDFNVVTLPFQPTLFVGNPPFSRETFDAMLRRMHRELPEGGRAACILPCYHFQTADSTMEWAKMFSITQQMIPRNLFPGLSLPLTWSIFTKERVRRMWGFLLYPEVSEVGKMSKDAKLMLVHGRARRSAWASIVDAALEAAGGTADLQTIYQFVEPRRPTENPSWKEQIRKVLQTASGYEPVGGGVWRFAAAA
jgi:adenine-specific DNA-methyltransferase